MTTQQRETEQKYRVNHLGVVEKVKTNDRLIQPKTSEQQQKARKAVEEVRNSMPKDNLAKGLTADGKKAPPKFSLKQGAPTDSPPTKNDNKTPLTGKPKSKDEESEKYKQAIYFLIIMLVFFGLTKTTERISIYTDSFDSEKSGAKEGVNSFITVIFNIAKFILEGIIGVLTTTLSFLWNLITTILGM